jgi:hypothetical protein
MSTATVQTQEVRLHWSRWFHCESSFNLMLVPNRPGIFAVAEETITGGNRRDLNVIQLAAADDLFHALNRLYAHDCPLREKLEKTRCFLRYAEVPDPKIRTELLAELRQWLETPGESASAFVQEFVAPEPQAEVPFRATSD